MFKYECVQFFFSFYIYKYINRYLNIILPKHLLQHYLYVIVFGVYIFQLSPRE